MDYYFCSINLKGINLKKNNVHSPDVPSAVRPILDSPDPPVTEPDGNREFSSDSKQSDMIVVAGDVTFKPEEDD